MRSKKKFLAAVLAVALTCSGLPIQGIGTVNVFAEEEAASEFEIDENGVLVKYNGTGGDVVIPEGVKRIGSRAFYGCSGLTSVTIPKGVTYISGDAFSGCSGLSSIMVDNGNSTYDSREDCNAIIETGSNRLVAGCKNTVIPDGITEIGYNAFDGCSGLTSVTIPESVAIISSSAFRGCSGLTSVTIPESVVAIRVWAFGECSSLKSIKIPSKVAEIGVWAFSGCNSLASITVDKENSTYDSREDCNAIIETESNKLIVGCKNTVIPKGVTGIDDGAFSFCRSLTNIIIPEGVINIATNAFIGCEELTSIEIPESVTYIGSAVFGGTKWLQEKRDENPLVVVNNILIDGTACNGDVEIPEGVTSIAGSAFYDCSGLTNIKITKSVTYIGSNAFNGTKWLEEKRKENPLVIENNILIDGITCDGDVEIPDGVINIGDSAFCNCSGLTGITISEGVTDIGDNAFQGCNKLTSITIPEGVKEIGDNAFSLCSSLTSITIPEGVTKIGDNAFQSCNKLISITIPESVIEIGKSAFSYSQTIKGKKGSYAETYANENGYRFVDIDADDTDDNNTGDNNTGDNSTVLMGDLNGDKKVNLNDAKELLKGAVGIITLTDEQKKVSDLNNDKKINLNDAKMLLRIAVGIA